MSVDLLGLLKLLLIPLSGLAAAVYLVVVRRRQG
jgi:hypothetical protein